MEKITVINYVFSQIEAARKNKNWDDTMIVDFLLELKDVYLKEEKKQTEDAINYGCSDRGSSKDVEQYYNETFGGEDEN
jgi:hypothetical protein